MQTELGILDFSGDPKQFPVREQDGIPTVLSP